MVKRVTLKQVAAHAGVSYQTVSKVINKKAQVSKETEERIWEAVRVLGYRPNQLARNLRTRQSRLIGYTWEGSPPDQANPILDKFLQSMAHAAEQAGYHLLCFPHHVKDKRIEGYRELIDTHRVDAFVVSGVEYDDSRLIYLQERDFPFVAFGRSNPEWDFPFVDIDGAEGMQTATQHLLEQGHRRIAALAWPENTRVGQNRLDGYKNAMRSAGISPHKEWIVRGEGRFSFGRDATIQLLELPANIRPTAIVALNDPMAIGSMHTARDKGLVIGKDLAITGFDDAPMVQYLTPALTSIRQPIWEVGLRIISILISILENKPPEEKHILLKPELIIRESSVGFQPEGNLESYSNDG